MVDDTVRRHVSGGGVGAGGGFPPPERNQEAGKRGRGRSSKHVQYPEGYLSAVGTPPPHNLYTLHGLVAGNTHIHTHKLSQFLSSTRLNNTFPVWFENRMSMF